MAANTVSDWTVTTVNSVLSMVCTIAVDAANQMAWTKRTPKNLDPKKPWTLIVSPSGEVDGQAAPLDIYLGYSDQCALAGTASITATDAVKFQQLIDDVGYASPTIPRAFHFSNSFGIANVVTVAAIATGLKSNIPVAPYYILNVNGATTLEARTLTFTILQKQ